MSDGPPSVQRVTVDTTDPDVGHQWLTDLYVHHTPRLSGPPERFRLRMVTAGVDRLRIGRLRHTMTADTATDTFGALVAIQLHGGRTRATAGRTTVDGDVGGWYLMDTARPMRVQWNDIALRTVTLDLGAARVLVEELTGRPAGTLDGRLTPLDRRRARYWSAACDHVERDLLACDELMANPLIRAQAFRTLAVALLTSFPNAALDAPGGGDGSAPGPVDPAVVRRAVAFVDEHAGEPIGVEDIARAARIGVRGLQLAFRRHRDTTPTEYLRRVRLELAHRDLRDGDPTRGDTVTAIAARWGFTRPGAFAVDYRRAYGRPPSATLRD